MLYEVITDTDLELAVRECILGALSFNGQRCTALKIIFVHRTIAERFLSRMDESMTMLHRGMPWEEGVFITPLPEPGKPRYP